MQSRQEFIRSMNADWDRLVADGDRRKDSMSPLLALTDFYRTLPEGERDFADEVLHSWLRQTSDLGRRFGALSVISDCNVTRAVPWLRALAAHLETDPAPISPYEWAKVNKLIAKLATPEC